MFVGMCVLKSVCVCAVDKESSCLHAASSKQLYLWINPTGSVDLEPNLLLMHDFKRIKLTCCCSSRLRVRELIVQTVLLVKYDVLSIDVGVYSCQGCGFFLFFLSLLLFFPSPACSRS